MKLLPLISLCALLGSSTCYEEGRITSRKKHLDYQAYLVDLYKRKSEGKLHNSDAFKTMCELADIQGIQCESHEVTTSDGYVLGIWRLPGLKGEGAADKPPVLLQHGLEADMMQWVYNKPEIAPAFVLAKAGYDVWLGNNRGNRFSQKHTNLDVKSAEFWDFDWEDMGTKDTPAVMDYIIQNTGVEKVSYIGHSEGTTQIMSGATLVPEFYHDKMKIAVLLAPPAAMFNNKVALLQLMSIPINRDLIVATAKILGFYNLIPYDFLNVVHEVQIICGLFDGEFCNMLLGTFADEDDSYDDTSRFDMYLSNLPSGAGWRNFAHYSQMIDQKSECFKRYDFGFFGNLQRYWWPSPPEYDLKKLDFPIAIFSGEFDELADPEDVKWTVAQMPAKSVVYDHEYPIGHMSFAIAKDMTWFTKDVMALLNHYNGICSDSTLDSRFETGNEKCKGEMASLY